MAPLRRGQPRGLGQRWRRLAGPRPAARSGSPSSAPPRARPGRDAGPGPRTASSPSRSSSWQPLDPATSDIGPGLATEWTPNDDNTVWTFKLRSGVKWQKGGDFTADDVVATMDRLAEAGNAGLGGVIEKGSTKAVDPTTVEFTLLGANGNFPYLVSVFNAQSLITPAAYATGTTLDGMPDGTGPWKLDSYDQATGAKYSRSDTWWGGTTPLDTVEFTFFDEPGPMVTAYQGDQIDAIVQFDVNSGAILFDDPNFNALSAKTTNHRQIWMRCDTGQFTDKRVRQALALSLDREAMVQQLFKGKGEVANDHVIFSLYNYFDPSVPQRTRDVEKAKQLLSDAGATGLKATLHAGRPPGGPGPRRAHPEQCRRRPGSS